MPMIRINANIQLANKEKATHLNMQRKEAEIASIDNSSRVTICNV